MGSDSDLEVMAEAAKILEEFEVSYEITVASAHRSPETVHKYATNAKNCGIKIIIAGAGGAAHLAGVIASFTTLPVIGVPIKTKNLDGLEFKHPDGGEEWKEMNCSDCHTGGA